VEDSSTGTYHAGNGRGRHKTQPEKEEITWIIHESRLPQIRGAGDEAVVLHRESAATKEMW